MWIKLKTSTTISRSNSISSLLDKHAQYIMRVMEIHMDVEEAVAEGGDEVGTEVDIQTTNPKKMAAILAGTQVGIQAGTQVVTQAGILVDIQIGTEVVVVEIGAIVMADIGEVEVGVVEVAEVMVGGVEGWAAVRFRGVLKSKHNFQ